MALGNTTLALRRFVPRAVEMALFVVEKGARRWRRRQHCRVRFFLQASIHTILYTHAR